MTSQPSILNYLQAGPLAPISNEPTDPEIFFDKERIKSRWTPHANATAPASTFPSTRNWTRSEQIFFKLHYHNVEKRDFTRGFCNLTAPTPTAQELIELQLGYGNFQNGEHVSLTNTRLVDFGEAIYLVCQADHTEAATDVLSRALLLICNPDLRSMVVSSQRTMMTVNVGADSFNSIPDGSVVPRKSKSVGQSPTLILVEDKQIGTDFGEFQIPGEMLATAVHNYKLTRVSQTIFAMRIIGYCVTFYRADFSKDYLDSVAAGNPCEHITIFRLGGADTSDNQGLAIAVPGPSRTFVVNALCSVMRVCMEDLVPSWDEQKEAVTTTQRLHLMQPTFL